MTTRPDCVPKWRVATGLALILACLAGGCERQPTTSSQPSGQPAGKSPGAIVSDKPAVARRQPTYRIGFSQCTVTEPWRVEFNRRLKERAEKAYPGVELTVLDAGDKTEEQVAQMKSFIEQELDAILISPKEAAGLTDVVREASQAGIPVVVLDRDVNWDGYACFVGGDNRLIGRAAGKVAIDLLGGPGRAQGVIYEVCGGLASTPGQERRDGFHEMVEREAGLKIIGGLDCDWKKDKAQRTFQDALKATEVIDLVYAHNDPMAHGAYQAAKMAGRNEEMKFIGIDSLPDEGIRWVKAGELTATLLYPTPGEVGLDMAMKILAGQKVEKRITLPTRVFTQDNADQGGEEVRFDEE